MGRLAGLGFQFAAAIILGVLGGQWIDRRLESDPWGILVGAFVGFGAGFLVIYHTVTEADRHDRERQDDERGER